MDFRLGPLTGKDNKPPPAGPFLALIRNIFVRTSGNLYCFIIAAGLLIPWVQFSLIWSVGATCDNSGRQNFDVWMRTKLHENTHRPIIPPQGLVYDYRYLIIYSNNARNNKAFKLDYMMGDLPIQLTMVNPLLPRGSTG